MKKSVVLAGVVAIASLAACQNPTITKAPGTYKSTSEHTSASGTTTKTNTTTHVYDDADGNRKAVQKTETTSDPKGLFNKKTTTSTKSYN